MKIGVKTYRSQAYLDHFKDKVDFFEIQAIRGVKLNLKKYDIPIIFHAEHQSFGVNPSDKTKVKENLDSLNYATKLADELKSKKIIYHAGRITDPNCSKGQSIDFIKKIKDKRILIENHSENMGLCTTPKEAKEFMRKTKKGFCLDLNHAITYAIRNKIEYISFLKEFIKLKPRHYHLCGQKIKNYFFFKTSLDHFSFKDSNIPIEKILSLLPKDAEITLEVTTDIKNTEYDLGYIRKFI